MQLILQNANNIEEIKKEIKNTEKYLSEMPYRYKVLEEARDYITEQKNIFTNLVNKVLTYLNQGYLEVPSFIERDLKPRIQEYKIFINECDREISYLKSYANKLQKSLTENKQLLKHLEKNENK